MTIFRYTSTETERDTLSAVFLSCLARERELGRSLTLEELFKVHAATAAFINRTSHKPNLKPVGLFIAGLITFIVIILILGYFL